MRDPSSLLEGFLYLRKDFNMEVKSKHDLTMYDMFAKIKLSSEYGMMVKSLSNEDKEIIKQAYKSDKSHVYFDTDSIRKEG